MRNAYQYIHAHTHTFTTYISFVHTRTSSLRAVLIPQHHHVVLVPEVGQGSGEPFIFDDLYLISYCMHIYIYMQMYIYIYIYTYIHMYVCMFR